MTDDKTPTDVETDADINTELEADELELTPRQAVAQSERDTLDARSDEDIVAARSADSDAADTDDFVKVFVIEPGPKPTEGNGYSHGANMAATRQYAISQGVRPTGDVRLVSIKAHNGNKAMGWDVTYAMPAVPAERFDFAEVHVITDNELDDNGHVGGVVDGDDASGSKGNGTGDEAPTMSSTREAIDAYGKSKGIDTTGAANKADALALLTKPTA